MACIVRQYTCFTEPHKEANRLGKQLHTQMSLRLVQTRDRWRPITATHDEVALPASTTQLAPLAAPADEVVHTCRARPWSA